MKSKSLFIEQNNSQSLFSNENEILNGTQIAEDMKTILRFRNGFLDGDVFDEEGKLCEVRPAVEGPGHLEYWRQNKLHRDNDEPAVISDGFSWKEWWVKGERVK